MAHQKDTQVNPANLPADTPLPPGDYGISRLNATKHGILSRYTVLPWESKEEYESLLNSLVSEHDPHGPTEMHLVEELAGIIWRKHRLRLAEAGCYGGPDSMMLNTVTPLHKSDNYLQFMPNAVPNEVYDEFYEDLVDTQFAKRVGNVRDALTSIQKAVNAVIEDKDVSEKEILPILNPHTEQSWETLKKYVRKGNNDIEKLVFFLQENMTPIYEMLLANISDENVPYMVERASSVNTNNLEKLTRYETTLDRKFERTLGMLLKVKDIRRKTGTIDA